MAYLHVENNIYLILNISISNNNEDNIYKVIINTLEQNRIAVSGVDSYPYAIECESEKDAHIKFREIKQLLERKAIIDLDLVKSL